MFAPKYVENKLKFFPYIKEAVAFGDKRDQVCAFINIDFEAVGNWAEKRNLPYAGYTDLAQKPEVYDADRATASRRSTPTSPPTTMLAGSQISRFLVLHKELDADDGELTRTRKVRRGFIAERYQVLVDALYGGKSEQYIETAGEVRGRAHRQGRGDAEDRRRRRRFPAVRQGRVMAGRARSARSSSTCSNISLALRRRQGADRHQLRRARARDPRHHRPQRRRQELDAQLHQRRLPAAAGLDHACAARPSST